MKIDFESYRLRQRADCPGATKLATALLISAALLRALSQATSIRRRPRSTLPTSTKYCTTFTTFLTGAGQVPLKSFMPNLIVGAAALVRAPWTGRVHQRGGAVKGTQV